MGELCDCPLKCKVKLVDVKEKIFDSFWDLSDFDKQNAYLFSCIEPYNVKKRYGKAAPEQSRRQKSYYFKVNIAGEMVRICKKTFMAVHGLQNNRGRVNNVL